MDEIEKLQGYRKHKAIKVSIDKEQLNVLHERIKQKIRDGHSHLSPAHLQKFRAKQDPEMLQTLARNLHKK